APPQAFPVRSKVTEALTSDGMQPRRSQLSGDTECRANRPELEAGLLQLGPGVRLRDDAAAGEEPCRRAGQLRAAQGDGPFSVAVRIHPTHRARVPSPVGALQLPDQSERLAGGRPT